MNSIVNIRIQSTGSNSMAARGYKNLSQAHYGSKDEELGLNIRNNDQNGQGVVGEVIPNNLSSTFF